LKAERLGRSIGHGGCGSVLSGDWNGLDTQSLSKINHLCDTRQRIPDMR
jgi:hypothetical protein